MHPIPRQRDPIRTLLLRLPVPAVLQAALLLVWDTFQNYARHRGGETAAAIAYYGLFAVFPLTLFIMSLASLLLGATASQEMIIEAVAAYIPGSEDLLRHTVQEAMAVRGSVTILALVGLLWSASGMFSLLGAAINRAWCADCDQPVWRQTAIGVVLPMIIGVLMIIAIASSGAAQVLHRYGTSLLPPSIASRVPSLNNITLAVGLIATMIALLILYKAVPVLYVPWRAALLGAIVAGLVWEGAKGVFAWYLSTIAARNLALTYGSLGAVIGLMLWTYVSAMIFLLGAELSAAYAQRKARTSAFTPVNGHE